MRTLITLVLVALFPIAVGGLGLGAYILYKALVDNRHVTDADIGVAFGLATIPLLLGAVATGAIGIICAVERSREETVAWLRHIARVPPPSFPPPPPMYPQQPPG